MAINALINQLTSKMTGPERATILLFRYGAPSIGGASKTMDTGAISVGKAVPVGGGAAAGAAGAPTGVSTSVASSALKAAGSIQVPVSLPSLPVQKGGENESSVSPGPSGNDAGLSYTSKMYTVAFNPETLEVSAEGGGLREQKKFGSTESGKSSTGATESITYVTNERRNMTMSVDLLFDQSNPGNAFTEFDPGKISGTTGGVGNIIGKIKDYSVQEEVEGFLAAVQNEMTNLIRFVWGDMMYTGRFNEVTAEYTMFNPQGYPIRAKVYLRLTLVDTSLAYNYMGNFQKSFDEVFKNGNTSWSSLNML